MHLRDTEEEAAFRAELRAWLAETVPTLPPEPDENDWPGAPGLRDRLAAPALRGRLRRHQLARRGRRQGASPGEQLIYLEEQSAAKAPDVSVNFVGLMHAGPTLIAEGTPEQKAHHLRGILRGEEVWCQGFSEPEAGSDLASLRTRAVRDGDHYVVTGQKIWTSYAPGRRLLRAARPHRPRRAEAQGHHLADPADGPARHRGAPARHHPRLGRVLRGVPRRGAHARRRTGSATRTTAGASPTSRSASSAAPASWARCSTPRT